MYLHRRRIAIISIQKKDSPRPLALPSFNDTITFSNSSYEDHVVNAQSGVYRDTDEPDLTISYAFNDIRVEGKQIFTAVLDALACAAQYDDVAEFESLKGTSASGNFEVGIFSDNPDKPYQITYSYVYTVLRDLILDIVVKLKKFSEMTFEIQWKSNQLGHGYMKTL